MTASLKQHFIADIKFKLGEREVVKEKWCLLPCQSTWKQTDQIAALFQRAVLSIISLRVQFSLFNTVTSYQKDLLDQIIASGNPLAQQTPRWKSSPLHAEASASEEALGTGSLLTQIKPQICIFEKPVSLADAFCLFPCERLNGMSIAGNQDRVPEDKGFNNQLWHCIVTKPFWISTSLPVPEYNNDHLPHEVY